MAKTYFFRFRKFIILILAVSLVIMGANIRNMKAEARTFHTPAELARLHDMLQSQPFDTNTYFATGGRCGGCHGHDPTQISLYTSWGEDVNIMDDWQGTMMANAAKDPLWRAKVSHEILVNPGIATEIQDKCTRCHAPTGRFESMYLGQPHYTMAMLATDTFGLDGVNCSACHQQQDTLMGNNFSGDLHYMQKHVYGPYDTIVSAVMEFFVGFTPSGSPHVKKSEFCASCHTLLTQTVDLSGNYTGGTFIEQATFHEWKNSVYRTDSLQCQHCHIPQINDPIKLATNYPFIPGRSPFGRHHLVGGNAFMLKLMQNNITQVGATCNPSNFDTTIARTTRQLRDSTLIMAVTQMNRTVDTVYYDVDLTNRCGHKFPSGYPSRIAWIQMVVTDPMGDTLYANGLQDVVGNLIGRDPGFEPHHDVCYTGNDVQIYEMVMGDVNNNPTTVLERADTCLKDNRICPKGFSASHPSYDSTKIIGIGNDPDFNYNGPTEGTGGDNVHYHIFLNGYSGQLNVTVKVYYSSVPRAWLNELFSYSSPEISSFNTMYNTADQTPMLVAQVDMNNTITNIDQHGNAVPQIEVYPNPTSDGKIHFTNWQTSGIQSVRVYDLQGKEVVSPIEGKEFTGELMLPRKGVYFVVLETRSGRVVKKVIY
ncbi:MAG: T9SS type A sorting domain-containing protein [Bacteroidetes bacterium]|nr:T9SS type A sorting domain-containing protein [Bacteroidota bacterium]